MERFKQFSLLLLLAFIAVSCNVDFEENPNEIYSDQELNQLSMELNLPEVPFSYAFGDDHKATFGRVLFYDKNLSADATVSCASCHQQSMAFADNESLSKGVNGNRTQRNSIALGSFRNFGKHYDQSITTKEVPGLFWDERASSIREQLRETINNPNEMGMELETIATAVQTKDHYQILHQKAFGNGKITEDDILESLEAFINSISSTNSEFETEVIGNLNFISGDAVTGSIDNAVGLEIFLNNCASCHGKSLNIPLTTPETFNLNIANNGLPILNNDLGAYTHTQLAEDKGKFKIPGLHNVELSAPYMHDGRFASLEEVVEFYNSGIQNSPTLHPSLKSGDAAKQLNLTDGEKLALVDFLKSLTDEDMVSNEKWSNPFK